MCFQPLYLQYSIECCVYRAKGIKSPIMLDCGLRRLEGESLIRLLNVKDTIFREGEYLVGSEMTGSHACYLLYGTIEPSTSRIMKASPGHAEIFLLIAGSASVQDDNGKQNLSRGQCFYYQDEDSAEVTNTGSESLIYVIAGGHTGSAGHHH